MPTTSSNTFDKMIRRIDGDESNLARGESLYYVDPKSNKVVNKSWLKKAFGKKYKAYIVGSSGAARHTAEGISREFDVKDLSTGRVLALSFEYRVSCPAGEEERLVECLAEYNTPEQGFDDLLDIAVENAMTKVSAGYFIDNYELEKKNLIEGVKTYLSNECGLSVELETKLKYEDQLTTIKISEVVPVRVNDQDDEYNLDIKIELSVIGQQKVKAVIAFPTQDKIQRKVLAIIKAFCKDNVNFNILYHGFRDKNKIASLETAINQRLQAYGRNLTYFVIKPKMVRDDIEETITIKLEETHQPYLSNTSITINNNLQLLLENPSVLKRSEMKKVGTWAEKRLREILKEEVFEKTYMDFLLSFDLVEASIKNRMCEELEKIGYKLKHLVSRPEMPEEQYLRAKAYNYTFENLPTRSAKVSVSFTVAMTYHFSDLSKIESILNKSQDVSNVIREAIGSYMETVLNEEYPETIYMKFSYDPDREKALEKTLSEGVAEKLIKDFGAELDGRPVVKPSNTAIGDFVEELLEQTEDFQLNIKPLGGISTFEFTGNITTRSVDPKSWDRICKMNFNLDDIKKFYLSALKSELEAFPNDDVLEYDSREHREQLQILANHGPVEAVMETYGIIVEVKNFARARTAKEINENRLLKAAQKDDIGAALEQIKEGKSKRKHFSAIAEKSRTHEKEEYTRAQEKLAKLENLTEEEIEEDEMPVYEKAKETIARIESAMAEQKPQISKTDEIKQRRQNKSKLNDGLRMLLENSANDKLEDKSQTFEGENHE